MGRFLGELGAKRWGGVAAAIGLAGIVAPATGAGAEPPVEPFSASAEAVGVRLIGTGQNAPATNTFLDLGGPVSQAGLDSLSTSTALAAHPFPGDAVISGPGLVAGLSNGQLTPPEYPFAVRSRHPSVPEKQLRQPGMVELEALSTAQEAHATAVGGSPDGRAEQPFSAGAHTEAAVKVQSDGVVARSSTLLQGVAFGPLRIAQLTSSARVQRHGTDDYRPETTLAVVGAAIGDQRIDVSEHGLVLGGQETATPAPPPQAVEGLEAHGISIRYLAGQAQGHVATSPGLVISWVGEVPGSPVSPVGVSLVLGRSSAAFNDVGGEGAAIGVPAAGSAAPGGSGPADGVNPPGGTVKEAAMPGSPGGTAAPAAPLPPPMAVAGGEMLPPPFPPSDGAWPAELAGAPAPAEPSPAAGLSSTVVPTGLAAVPVSTAAAGGLPPVTGAWAAMVLAGLLGTASFGAVVLRR